MSERVPLMACGDGVNRADHGCYGQGPYAKTANYTIKPGPADSGKVFSNSGAAGAVTFTLPKPAKGLWYVFLVIAAQTLTVQASNNAKVNNSAANGTYAAAGTQAGVGNVCVWSDGANWFSAGPQGTWTTT
jgi:hypothetical protein